MSSSKAIVSTDNDRTLLSVLSMSVFFVGASEFMLSTMLNPLSVAFGTDSVGIAWLISSYAFAYAIATPFLDYLSDRINRSRLLLIALLSFAIDGVGIAFAPTLEIAIALRTFGGLASAVIIPAAFALISEVITRLRPYSFPGLDVRPHDVNGGHIEIKQEHGRYVLAVEVDAICREAVLMGRIRKLEQQLRAVSIQHRRHRL